VGIFFIVTAQGFAWLMRGLHRRAPLTVLSAQGAHFYFRQSLYRFKVARND
jgi:hypothetical protein